MTRHLPRWLCLAAGLIVTGCFVPGPEALDDAPAPTESAVYMAPEASDFAALDAAPAPLRRLTKSQFHNVLTDLFGDDVAIPELDEPDTILDGLVAIGTGKTTFSPRAVSSLEKAALGIASQVLDSDTLRETFVPCTPAGIVDDACVREALTPIARHVWRRPPESVELDQLSTLAGEAATILDDFHEGLRFAIAGVLQSPHFIFRAEVGELRDGQHVFTDLELASRLSFFLWNSGPDAELLDAAIAGDLSSLEGLMDQADRLLASPRARSGLKTFFIEYLQLQELDELRKDPTLFEHYDAELGADAKEEVLRTLEHFVFDQPGDFRDVMTTRTTFVSPRLAALYGIPAPTAEGFEQVELPKDGQRRGLLGQAAFLALHAHEVSTSATRRGLAVRSVLLCQAIPEPPVDVDTSIPEPSGDLPTLRDRVKEHLENPACAGCHELLDPIGLGLENFDGLGRWRATDNGVLIDASGDLDNAYFETPSELAERVREHPDFVPCVVKTLARYARGRTEGPDDKAALEVLGSRFAGSGHDFRSLVLDVIASPLFRHVGEPTEED